MKVVFLILGILVLVIGACGSEVTEPESGGGTEPDTTEYEHTVLYIAEVFTGSPDYIHVSYLENGQIAGLDVDSLKWEYEIEANSGDSLYIQCYALPYTDEMTHVAIYVDGEYAASAGADWGPQEVSYVLQ